MQRAVLFDLDDTLLDRSAAIPAFVISQARRLLEMQVPDAVRFAERFVELEERGRVWKDQVYRELGREFPPARHADERLLKVSAVVSKGLPLATGRGRTVAPAPGQWHQSRIVTNGRSDMQLAVVSALGLGDLMCGRHLSS
ncbi:hypothetical protein ACRQ5Q_33925 [Bradyrhizobium sp. PMVTL-01]|uniref:hypothetical protein n=1 Tax=Bradyrhizobium sp. PMVTL-01 TaxID=3434999 RepID=UPI003F72FE3A